MPGGGQLVAERPPMCSGKIAKWKNAQKNPTKNITSLLINSVMP